MAKAVKTKFNANKYLRPGLTEDEIEEIKEAFDLFDTDGSGIADAITVGARLTMAPATPDAQWIETEGAGG